MMKSGHEPCGRRFLINVFLQSFQCLCPGSELQKLHVKSPVNMRLGPCSRSHSPITHLPGLWSVLFLLSSGTGGSVPHRSMSHLWKGSSLLFWYEICLLSSQSKSVKSEQPKRPSGSCNLLMMERGKPQNVPSTAFCGQQVTKPAWILETRGEFPSTSLMPWNGEGYNFRIRPKGNCCESWFCYLLAIAFGPNIWHLCTLIYSSMKEGLKLPITGEDNM